MKLAKAYKNNSPITITLNKNELTGPESCCVYIQDRGFNSFADNMVKFSVNETKMTGFLASTRASIP